MRNARRSLFDALLAPVGVRSGLAAGGRHLVPRHAGRAREKEIGKRLVEHRHVVARAAQNGPKGVANRALVGQIHDLERARRVVQLTRTDAETVIAAQQRAERDQVLGQAAQTGTSARRGVETEPNPKSVSRLWPPDSSGPGASSRIGSSAA